MSSIFTHAFTAAKPDVAWDRNTMYADTSASGIVIDDFAYKMPPGSKTIEFWNYGKGVSGPEYAFFMYPDSVNRVSSHLYWHGDGAIYFDNGDLSNGDLSNGGRLSVPGGAGYSDGQWTHFAYVVDTDDNHMSVYANGVQIGRTNSSRVFVPNSTSMQFKIGGQQGLRHDALVGEFRIWDHARTTVQVQSTMNLSLNSKRQGLVGCWRMDDAVSVGDTVLDRSGNKYHGIVTS